LLISSISAAESDLHQDTAASVRAHNRERVKLSQDIAAGIAHELRNPVLAVSSAAQLLRYRITDDPVVEKNIGRILREVERLNHMVTALLEYGRPEPVHLVPGDPDAVWDEVLDANRGRLEERALQVRRTRAEPHVRAPIDRELLAQVFVNVLLNAIDAAPEASDLVLTSVRPQGGGWRCRLQNGGPVIPPDVLPRLFELFFSTKPGGAGIGLALCQRIIDEHHGSIAIDSVDGSGTTVTIALPAT